MTSATVPTRVGVFVDSVNVTRNGGYGMQYDVLREFACRGEGLAMRLNAYAAYDAERAESDNQYRINQRKFYDVLREQGYKVILKNVKWYIDERGVRIGKANSDLDLAVDVLSQSQNMDRILIATGDGDFVQVVRALQSRGCRVEVVAFDNVSTDLRREADLFLSGYLIPGLLPLEGEGNVRWGEAGGKARGTCYYFNAEKGFGFVRFLKEIGSNLWDVDSRKIGSPFASAFFHVSELPRGVTADDLPNRDMIFEFDLAKSNRPQTGENYTDLLATHLVRAQRENGRDTAAPRTDKDPNSEETPPVRQAEGRERQPRYNDRNARSGENVSRYSESGRDNSGYVSRYLADTNNRD